VIRVHASVWLGVAFSMRQLNWSIIAFAAGAFITAVALVIAVAWSQPTRSTVATKCRQQASLKCSLPGP